MTNGNPLTARFDPDEITSTVLQTFPMAHDHGVLRRTLTGGYQLKFYDRFSVINLPAEPGGYHVAATQVMNDGDLALFVEAPRPGCPQHGYVFLISKNDATSREAQSNLCQPLATASNAQHSFWLLRSALPRPGSPVWVVQNGTLYLAQDRRGAAGGGAYAKGGSTMTAASRPMPGVAWHIENGGVLAAARRSPERPPRRGLDAARAAASLARPAAASFDLPSEVRVVSAPTAQPVMVKIR